MNVASLFDEFYAQVSQYLSAIDVGALWLCGNRVLNEKLARSVSHFALHFTSWNPCVFPALVRSFLRLRHLNLRPTKEYNSPLNTVTWNALPVSLTSLELCIGIQRNSEPTPGLSGHTNDLLAPLDDDTLEGVQVLPHLRTLTFEVSKKADSCGVFPNFALWTPNLECLHISYPTLYCITPILRPSRLPRSLLELKGTFSSIDDSPDVQWPPHLSKLSIFFTSHAQVRQQHPQWIRQLPKKSITSLSISPHVQVPKDFDWQQELPHLRHMFAYASGLEFEQIQMLPRVLQTAEFAGAPFAWRSSALDVLRHAFPPNLTQMDWPWPDSLTVELAQALPRSLTLINDEIVIESEAVAHLPPRVVVVGLELLDALPEALAKLTVEKLTMFEASDWRYFPKGLKELDLRDELLFEDDELVWPSTLLKLEMQWNSMLVAFDTLPRSLTSLTNRSYYEPEFSSEDDDDDDDAIPVSPSSDLPAGLTSLSLPHVSIEDGEWCLNLPAGLTSLEFLLLRVSSLDLLLSIGSTCPELMRLTLPLVQAPTTQEEIPRLLRTLPRHLTACTITVPGQRDSKLQNAHLASLPRGLLTLTLPHSPHISSECLSTLPKRLCTLTLGDKQALSDWKKQKLQGNQQTKTRRS